MVTPAAMESTIASAFFISLIVFVTIGTCFGSTASAVVLGQHILAVVNCAHLSKRENLVCRISYDDGRTWAKSLVVEPGDAGYADIALTADGTLYVLYEQSAGVRDRLAVFTTDNFR